MHESTSAARDPILRPGRGSPRDRPEVSPQLTLRRGRVKMPSIAPDAAPAAISWGWRSIQVICPYCGQDNDKVIDSRASDGGVTVRRRRE